ncbi:MAG: hypothetical protein GX604_06445 [Actinobacteria bacterium]|nr:hypothetical protein [Actinomycetota bacterium]
MKGPRLTWLRLLIVAALAGVIASILLKPMDDPYAVKDPPPPEIARILHAIAKATRAYLARTGSVPQTLGDLRDVEVPVTNDHNAERLQIGDLPLEGITYTPEFLGSAGIILAYVPVSGDTRLAVLYYFPDEVVMRTKEQLDAELRALREERLSGKGGSAGGLQSQPD